MLKIRKAAVATLTAGALVLSATPAMAQTSDAAPTQQTSGPSLSSVIGDGLDATPSERDVWGSEKGGENAGTFTWLWYGYTLAATAAVVAGVSYVVYPAVQDALSTYGYVLPDRPALPF